MPISPISLAALQSSPSVGNPIAASGPELVGLEPYSVSAGGGAFVATDARKGVGRLGDAARGLAHHISADLRAALAHKTLAAKLRWALNAPAFLVETPLALGTDALPFEAIPQRRQLLSLLEPKLTQAPGRSRSKPAELVEQRRLSLQLRCASQGPLVGKVTEDLELLRRLDLDHAICVAWRLDLGDPTSQVSAASPSAGRSLLSHTGLQAILEAARRLDHAGIETRLELSLPEALAARQGRRQNPPKKVPTAFAEELERLFLRAKEAGVSDIRVTNESSRTVHLMIRAMGLRYGFPQAQPSRG